MKQWKARLPLGALLIAAIVGLTMFDANAARPVVGPILAAALGLLAAYESLRMASSAVDGTARAIASVFALTGAALCVAAPLRGDAPEAFVAYWTALWASIGGVVANVFRRRASPVAKEDVLGPAVAALLLALTVAPLCALGSIAGIDARGVSGDRIGPWLLFATVLTAKLNDIGGYLFGSAIGGPKLCPGVSPGKTWSGAIGGFALALGGASVLASTLPALAGTFAPVDVLLYAAAISIAAQIGDLSESLVKRAFAVKDSGALLPAFGGAFDLVDSFILVGPVGYTLLRAATA